MVKMVDTRATHNFVASKILKEYGLKVTDCAMRVKSINYTVQPGYVTALDVWLTTIHWTGMYYLIVVSLNGLNILLGIDFMRKFRLTKISHLDGLMFGGKPIFVNGIYLFDE